MNITENPPTTRLFTVVCSDAELRFLRDTLLFVKAPRNEGRGFDAPIVTETLNTIKRALEG